MRFTCHFFTVVFAKGTLPSRHSQSSLAMLLLTRAPFADKFGSHAGIIVNSTETAVKLKQPLSGRKNLRKRPCKQARTKNLRKWSEFFFYIFKPIFLRKGRHFFAFCSHTILHWLSSFLATPQPLGVCAVAPSKSIELQTQQCDRSQLNLQGSNAKILYCHRCFRLDAIPTHCNLCSHIDYAKLTNFEMTKWIFGPFVHYASLVAQQSLLRDRIPLIKRDLQRTKPGSNKASADEQSFLFAR